MSKTVYIYALCEPDLWQEIRYIGATTKPPTRRLASHLAPSSSSLKDGLPLAAWLKSLLAQNLKPSIQILEETTTDNWQEAERRWIAQYRANGARLTNVSPGGNTNAEETKKIIRAIAGSPESRARLSAAVKKGWADPEKRAKWSANMRGPRKKKEAS